MHRFEIEPWNVDNIDNYLVRQHISPQKLQEQVKSDPSIKQITKHKKHTQSQTKKTQDQGKNYLEKINNQKQLAHLLNKRLQTKKRLVDQSKLKSVSSIEQGHYQGYMNPLHFEMNLLPPGKLLRVEKIQQQFRNQIQSIKDNSKEKNKSCWSYKKRVITEHNENSSQERSYRNNYSYLVELQERKQNKKIRDELKLQQRSMQLPSLESMPRYPKLPRITPLKQQERVGKVW